MFSWCCLLYTSTLDIRRNKLIYILLIVILGFFAVFNYAPMVGLLMAFQDYSPARGILGSEWVRCV